MPDILVVGTGVTPWHLPPEHAAAVAGADILVGGRDLLDLFFDHPGEKWTIRAPMAPLLTRMIDPAASRQVVVLASGDPLFHGIGTTLVSAFGAGQVRILPNTSFASVACARIGIAFDHTRVISLHRQEASGFLTTLKTADQAILLTSPERSPAWIGTRLAAAEMTHFNCWIMEHLGKETEQIRRMDVRELSTADAENPNLVVLVRDPAAPLSWEPFHQGMPVSAYHHQSSLITKPEIRSIAIARLQLKPGQVLWDLGAGSGSISIEASPLIGTGDIIAVEKHPDRLSDILKNVQKFGAFNVRPIRSDLPQGMEALPDPDRIFIGGGGPDLEIILNTAIDRLTAGGIIVVHTVLLGSLQTAIQVFEQNAITPDILQVQVSAGSPLNGDIRFKAQNPVWIISAVKREAS